MRTRRQELGGPPAEPISSPAPATLLQVTPTGLHGDGTFPTHAALPSFLRCTFSVLSTMGLGRSPITASVGVSPPGHCGHFPAADTAELSPCVELAFHVSFCKTPDCIFLLFLQSRVCCYLGRFQMYSILTMTM